MKGRRFTVVDAIWPERVGCTGVTAPIGDNLYPWAGRGVNEVVVLLDDDPLRIAGHDPRWSCVYGVKDLRFDD